MARQASPSIFARFASRPQGGRSDSFVPPNGFEQIGGGAGENGGPTGRDTSGPDAGTINPSANAQKRPKRPRGRPPNASRAADASAAETQEKVSLEPPPDLSATVVGQIAQ